MKTLSSDLFPPWRHNLSIPDLPYLEATQHKLHALNNSKASASHASSYTAQARFSGRALCVIGTKKSACPLLDLSDLCAHLHVLSTKLFLQNLSNEFHSGSRRSSASFTSHDTQICLDMCRRNFYLTKYKGKPYVLCNISIVHCLSRTEVMTPCIVICLLVVSCVSEGCEEHIWRPGVQLYVDRSWCWRLWLFLQNEAAHALYEPVIQTDGQLAAVVELWRRDAFHEEDEEIASSYLVWGGIALHYAQLYLSMNKQRKLNDFLLAVVK